VTKLREQWWISLVKFQGGHLPSMQFQWSHEANTRPTQMERHWVSCLMCAAKLSLPWKARKDQEAATAMTAKCDSASWRDLGTGSPYGEETVGPQLRVTHLCWCPSSHNCPEVTQDVDDRKQVMGGRGLSTIFANFLYLCNYCKINSLLKNPISSVQFLFLL
jgi:hypothetical protein